MFSIITVKMVGEHWSPNWSLEICCQFWYELFGLWTERSWLKLRHPGEPELWLTKLSPGILRAEKIKCDYSWRQQDLGFARTYLFFTKMYVSSNVGCWFRAEVKVQWHLELIWFWREASFEAITLQVHQWMIISFLAEGWLQDRASLQLKTEVMLYLRHAH